MALTGDIYRWFYGRLFKRPSNFNWVISNKLAASGLIKTHKEFEWVLKQGVKSIVTIRETSLPPKYFETSEKEEHGINEIVDYLHIKVEDHDAPELDVLIKTINFIESHIEETKAILIHCNGGRGRTGVIVTAYLMKKYQISLNDALEKVKLIRKRIPHRGRQRDVLKAYEQYLKDSSISY